MLEEMKILNIKLKLRRMKFTRFTKKIKMEEIIELNREIIKVIVMTLSKKEED